MPTTPAAAPLAVEREPCIVLRAIPWGQYEDVLKAFPDQGGLRITYHDGKLTLLSPLYLHDWFVNCLDQVVVAVADGFEIEWTKAGSTTYRREDLSAGVEGDEVYYFGPNAERMTGVRAVDLSTQPPPDLAIEVEVTHPADDAVAIWGKLGVPEVWRFDAREGTWTFGLRRDDGTYASSPRSGFFPALEPEDVLGQLRLADRLVMSQWTRQLRDWVRDVVLPRSGK